MDEDKYFDLKGLSTYSSLGLSTLRDYIRKHGLPCFKVRGKVLVQKSQFDEWLQGFQMRRNVDLNALVNDVVRSIKRNKSRRGPGRTTKQANFG